MKKMSKFRSEDGAASVLEATIVFPLVFLVVIFLVLVGFTYAQRGVLTYQSSALSHYLAKVICYPGYNYLDTPFYENDNTVTIDDVSSAMKAQAPYRYLFGLFGTEYSSAEDQNGNNLIKTCTEKMVTDYMQTHSFLKTSGGTVSMPKGVEFGYSCNQNGYACGVSANTSRVVVYLGQNYVFGNFLRMIGIGGRQIVIDAQSTAFISDSLEIVRMTDMAFDLVNFVMDKLGVDKSKIENIKEMITKVTGNS